MACEGCERRKRWMTEKIGEVREAISSVTRRGAFRAPTIDPNSVHANTVDSIRTKPRETTEDEAL